jgi:hypothetical protein
VVHFTSFADPKYSFEPVEARERGIRYEGMMVDFWEWVRRRDERARDR